MILWPRLPLPRAKALAVDLSGRTLLQMRETSWDTAVWKLYAPTGGVRVDDTTLRGLRRELDGIASNAGFPAPARRESRARFDSGVSQYLADYPIAAGEALRAETWAWLAVVLVPHLVTWRWMGDDGVVAPERFAGAVVRNALGRLWYQAVSLDRGKDSPDRWELLRSLGADQAVALFERPTLAANREICLSIARVWTALPEATRREELFRQSMKALVVRAGVYRLDILEDDALDDVVGACFYRTADRLAAK